MVKEKDGTIKEKDGGIKLGKQSLVWLKKKFLEHHRAIDAAETGGAISNKDYLQAQLIEDELNHRGIQVDITERRVYSYRFYKGRK